MKLSIFELKKLNKHLDKNHVSLINCALKSKSKSIEILDEENDRIDNVLHLERVKNQAVCKIIGLIKKQNQNLDSKILENLEEIKDLCSPTPTNNAEYFQKLERMILKDLTLEGFVEYKDFRLKLSFDTINNKPSYFTLYILEDLSNGVFDLCNINLLTTYSLQDLHLNKKVLKND